jgi:large subunit ribosomal protein L10
MGMEDANRHGRPYDSALPGGEAEAQWLDRRRKSCIGAHLAGGFASSRLGNGNVSAPSETAGGGFPSLISRQDGEEFLPVRLAVRVCLVIGHGNPSPLDNRGAISRNGFTRPVHVVPGLWSRGMDRAQKAEAVATLKQTFGEVGVVVVTRNLGMTVAQSTALRGKMRDAGASYKVAKNTLTLIALEGTAYAPISDMLTGPTALATSADPVAAAKVAVDFAKTNDKFEIVGGAMGDTLLDVNGVKALAELPSLDELRATIIGLVQAPATKIARTINEPGAQLARVFGAFAAKENA